MDEKSPPRRVLAAPLGAAALVLSSLLALAWLEAGLLGDPSRRTEPLPVALAGEVPGLEDLSIEPELGAEAAAASLASAPGGRAPGDRAPRVPGRGEAPGAGPAARTAVSSAASLDAPSLLDGAVERGDSGSARSFSGALEDSASKGLKVVRRTRVLEMALVRAPTGPPPPRRVAVPARATYRPAPQFPAEARDQDKEGSVTVRVLIGEDGSVTRYEVTGGERRESFEAALAPVVPTWRFQPALDAAGKPIESWKEYACMFKLQSAGR